MILDKAYKHRSNKDVAFIPRQIEKEDESSLTFFGEWYNIISVGKYLIDYDSITINREDLDNWREYNELCVQKHRTSEM